MSVRVKVSSPLRIFTNWQEIVEVTGDTVGECIMGLEAVFPGVRQWMYDKEGQLLPLLHFFVNGEEISVDELATPVKDGGELFVLFAIGGG